MPSGVGMPPVLTPRAHTNPPWAKRFAEWGCRPVSKFRKRESIRPPGTGGLRVVRVGGDDGELRPWHYIYVYSNKVWIRI